MALQWLNPLSISFPGSLRANMLLRYAYAHGITFIKAPQKEIPALCVSLQHLHTSHPPPLMKHFPVEYPLYQWPGGAEDWSGGNQGRAQGQERDASAQGLPKGLLGAPVGVSVLWDLLPPCYSLTQGTARSSADYVFEQQHNNYFSIQMPRMGGWPMCQLIGYMALLWWLKSWINSLISTFVFLW